MKETPQTLDRDWMTRAQAAIYLQVSTATVSKLVRDGKLVGTKLGSGRNCHLRISAASIEKFLEFGRC